MKRPAASRPLGGNMPRRRLLRGEMRLTPRLSFNNALKVLFGMSALVTLLMSFSCAEGGFLEWLCDYLPADPATQTFMMWGSCSAIFAFMCCPCCSLDSDMVDSASTRGVQNSASADGDLEGGAVLSEDSEPLLP